MNQKLIAAFRWHRQHHSRAIRAIEYARDDIAREKARYPHGSNHVYSGSWQSVESVPLYGSRAYFCDNWPNWRNLGNVGEIRSESSYGGRYVEHTGWYTDEFQEDTIAGYVLQLPARSGVCLYVPGTKQTGCDGVTLYPLDRYEDIGDCARAADRYAEKDAETEREYQEAWRAGNDAQESHEEAIKARREILKICKEARADLDTDAATWSLVKSRVSQLLRDMCEARERRDELKSQFNNHEAFNEGFDTL